MKGAEGKLILIGIDGANPRRIKSLLKENKIPNIARLIQEGSFCENVLPP